jgi:hypothetical protein
MNWKKVLGLLAVLMLSVLQTASAADMSGVGYLIGIPPYFLQNVTFYAVIVFIISWLIIAPSTLLLLIKWWFKDNYSRFRHFLVLGFVLNTSGFIASLSASVALIRFATIPALLIGYVIGLLIWALILMFNDMLLEAIKM